VDSLHAVLEPLFEPLAPPAGRQKVNAEADFAHDDRVDDQVAFTSATRPP
jgi:hypothetical protein